MMTVHQKAAMRGWRVNFMPFILNAFTRIMTQLRIRQQSMKP